VWVNPTYLWPGIVGGLIMGAGFIIGGFCPGTSLVAAATFKIDGLFFALGTFFGIFLFGETVESFESFWHSSYMGRFTLQELFGADAGVIALGVVVMAIVAFAGAEYLEHRIGGKKPIGQRPRWRYVAAGVVVVIAVFLVVVGQPTTDDKWQRVAAEKSALLEAREVQIHPGELLDLIHDDTINLVMLDVRNEVDYNLFHILDAQHTPLDTIAESAPVLLMESFPTVFVVMSNDEVLATEAWKILEAESVPNVYILSGGLNNWLDTFASEEFKTENALNMSGDDLLRYTFEAALGDRHPAAEPHPDH
jgi:hypothetical protein